MNVVERALRRIHFSDLPPPEVSGHADGSGTIRFGSFGILECLLGLSTWRAARSRAVREIDAVERVCDLIISVYPSSTLRGDGWQQE